MSRFVQLEAGSLTGANADQRVRVRDSNLALIVPPLARADRRRKIGPLAADAAVGQALAPFASPTRRPGPASM